MSGAATDASGAAIAGAQVVAVETSTLVEQVSWLNPGDSELERRISPLDRPHGVVVSGVYELPVG